MSVIIRDQRVSCICDDKVLPASSTEWESKITLLYILSVTISLPLKLRFIRNIKRNLKHKKKLIFAISSMFVVLLTVITFISKVALYDISSIIVVVLRPNLSRSTMYTTCRGSGECTSQCRTPGSRDTSLHLPRTESVHEYFCTIKNRMC